MFEIMLGCGKKPYIDLPGSDVSICDPSTGVCFYGEVSANGLISGVDLANLIGLNLGTEINNESGWLKFSLKDQMYFIAKKPFRSHLRMSSFFSQTKDITIGDRPYKARTFIGTNSSFSTAYDPTHQHGTEWNKFMYSVFNGSGFSSEGIEFGLLAKYTATELGLLGNGGCSVTTMSNSSQMQFRGGWGTGNQPVVAYSRGDKSGAPHTPGWRPILIPAM